ncbi:MAG: hypothetical protein ACRBK7_10945 [Acidimicrobiales bacterium]
MTDDSISIDVLAQKGARWFACAYVTVLVCVSLLAASSSALGYSAQVIGSEPMSAALDRGDLVLRAELDQADGTTEVSSSGGVVIPLAGLPALWLTDDQRWFTVWFIVTLVATMLAIPAPLRSMIGPTNAGVVPRSESVRPRSSRLLVVVSSGPVILVLLATLPFA